jgi:hypothetical protein
MTDYIVRHKYDGSQSGDDIWRTNFRRTVGGGSGVGACVPEPWLGTRRLKRRALSRQIDGRYAFARLVFLAIRCPSR